MFTSSPSPSGASEVRRSVSGITSAANDPPFGSTAVRQTPFTAIESPGDELGGERRLHLESAVAQRADHPLAGYEPREHLTTP